MHCVQSECVPAPEVFRRCYKGRDGYYTVCRPRSQGGELVYGHRLIYEECFGWIPKSLLVRHSCDNRACVSPEHLEIGTYQDNVNDAVERGRHARGEMFSQSKLTEDDIPVIRERLKRESQRAIAKDYRVHQMTISKVATGRTWRHVK